MFFSRVSVVLFFVLLVFSAVVVPAVGQSGDFEVVAPSHNALSVGDGEIQARLNPHGCDEGFETACSVTHQRQRSEYIPIQAHQHGDRVVYKWDVLVPKTFVYNAVGAYLRAGRFFDTSGESFFSFILDGSDGYHVSRKICFGPDGFGKWHSVEVRIAWDSTKKKDFKDRTPGELRVFCDGQEVLSRVGRPNIGADENAKLALGLMGAVELAEGDNVVVSFRNVDIFAY